MIRQAIKKQIEVRNLNKSDLAREIGITVNSMYRFLNGTINLTVDKLETLLELCGLEITVKAAE